jgi:hypothetical protein
VNGGNEENRIDWGVKSHETEQKDSNDLLELAGREVRSEDFSS